MRARRPYPPHMRLILCLALAALVTACGADPAADAGPVCDPGWTCPDCRNYVRLRDGGCFLLDNNACGPARERCGAGRVCASGSESRSDPDSGERYTVKTIQCVSAQ